MKKYFEGQGFDEQGGAVLMGSKEEVDAALKRMEAEGETEDLESYIRMHKEVVMPKQAINFSGF